MKRLGLFVFVSLLMVGMLSSCKGPAGAPGAAGTAGDKGDTGPTGPVINSMSVFPILVEKGGNATVKVNAKSYTNLALSYSWSATPGWTITVGQGTDTVTVQAPLLFNVVGGVTVTVTDTNSMSATGFASIGTADGDWNIATLIETGAGDALNPQVATDPNGNAIAVWYQVDVTRNSIWANRYVPGTGWGTAQLIETDNTGDALYPQVGIDPNGNAIAVWYQFDGTRNSIWANRYVPGTGWGTAQLIETDNAGDASGPQVAIDPNGNAIAVWEQSDGTRYNIWANRYVPGTGWGTAQLIETGAGAALNPQVGIDPNGNAIAVWYQSDGTRYNIWANRYVPGTGWGSAQLIETDNAESAYSPQVAIDPNGNAIAVWYQSDNTRYNIWANRYVPGTGWGTAQLIETDNSGDASHPQVGIDPNGNAIAVWEQYDGTRFNIWANRYVPGTGWGTAQLIETDNAGDADAPQVGIDPNGNAIAVWYKWDGTRYNIWANRYVPGTGWGTAQLIETDNTGDAYYPQVAIDPNGNAIAVWRQSDGARSNIWANRFE